jgi:hypothetical protein
MFGLAGVVLSIVGLSLFAASLWASVLYAAPRSEPKPVDNTAVIQRLLEESDAKTLGAIKEINKQSTDQVKQLAEELEVRDNQMQSQIIGIRTALTERPEATPRTNDETKSTTSKKQRTKTR